jgi:acyl-CoA hydrolase
VPTIAETRFQMVQLVFPEHINIRGTLYGGRMMSWIATAGTLAASRFARGPVVLGAMDDLDFLGPVYLGEIVTLDAQVEHVGRTSLEVGVEVHSESPRVGLRRKTTSSHLAFIALDEHERPRPVGRAITPGSPGEEAVHAEAAARKAARSARVRRPDPEADVIPETPVRHAAVLSRLVLPEDALAGTLMFAGKLLGTLDETASIVAVRYCRGAVVTAALDTVYFFHPLRVGEIVDVRAVLTYVGRSSMEIGVRVDSEEPQTGRRSHTCTAFLAMVHVDGEGRPAPVPPLVPATGAERRLWAAGEARSRTRKARVAQLREMAGRDAH